MVSSRASATRGPKEWANLGSGPGAQEAVSTRLVLSRIAVSGETTAKGVAQAAPPRCQNRKKSRTTKY